MSRKGNHNIFVGDRAYQTTFFLNFKSPMSEQKFQSDTFIRTRYFLQGYLLACFSYLIWNFINSTCFNFYYDCKHTSLLLISLLCLVGAFPIIKKKNPTLVGILFLAPNLYIHLVLIDTYSYYLTVHFTVVQTVIASALVFHTWKSQLIFNVINYALLAMSVKYVNLEFLIGGNVWQFLEDLLLYHIIPLLLSAYIEKGRRERWVLLDTFKKSENIFISLVESILIPVFVIDSNKRVLYANQHAQGILRKYFKNVTGRIPLHKMNVVFSHLLTKDSQNILEKLLSGSDLEQESQAKIVLKEAQEEQEVQQDAAGPPSAWSTLLGTRLEQLFQSSNNIYQATCRKIVWKKSYANLLCIQDITKTLKVQEVMSSNFTKLIDEARTSIESAGASFDNFSAATLQNSNYKPLTQAISNMDKLRYALQNTSLAYDIACGKFKIEMERFNIRDHIIYLLEVLSIQTVKQKLETKLTFEASFPFLVTGDYLKFLQLLHNVFSSIIENCKDGIIKFNCNMMSVDLTQEATYHLEFEIEFPKSQTLQFENFRDLINEEYQQDSATNILKKNDFEAKLLLFKPLLSILKGTSTVTDHNDTIVLKFEAPFGTNPPSPSNRSQRRTEPVPSFDKFHFTYTRSSNGEHVHKWDAQPNQIQAPAPVAVAAPAKTEPLSCPSPMLNSKISEKIKAQFSEAAASTPGTITRQLSANSNHNRTSTFQEFKKQQKIRQNLLRISGENLPGFASDESSMKPSASNTPEPFEKGSRLEVPEDESEKVNKEKTEVKTKEEKHEERKEPDIGNIVKIVKKKSQGLGDNNLPQILKSPGVVKALELSKTKAQNSDSTEQTSHREDTVPVSKLTSVEKPVEEVAEADQVDTTDWEEKKASYKENKERPSSWQMENDRPIIPVHKRSTTAITAPVQQNSDSKTSTVVKSNQLYSPSNGNSRRFSERGGMPNKLFKYLDTRKGSVDSVDGEVMFFSDLRSYERLLKIAISNVLIEIFTVFCKNPNTFNLHVSRLDIDAAVIEEKEEASPVPIDLNEKEPSLTSLESENKDQAMRDIVKTSFNSDKLNGDELLDKVMNCLMSKLAGTRSEKEFVNFLIGYVRTAEKKLRGFCTTISVTPCEEDDYEQMGLENSEGGRMSRHKSQNPKLNRVGSSESIFSMDSNASGGEKVVNLTERILMSPAVKKMLTFKHNPTRMIHKVIDVKDDTSIKAEKPRQDSQSHRKKASKSVADAPIEKPKKDSKREEQEKELLPFGRPAANLPMFLSVRVEPQRRKWKGGHQTVYSKDPASDFKYLENFTILAVDDSTFILDALKLIVTPYKKQFEFAKDGFEALKKFQSISKQGLLYHLILMDIMMPNCGGVEATRLIREHEKKHGCPRTFICGVSSFEDPNTKKECFDAGMDDFCCKPINSQKLGDFIVSRCQALKLELPYADGQGEVRK